MQHGCGFVVLPGREPTVGILHGVPLHRTDCPIRCRRRLEDRRDSIDNFVME
jgi:hypothetical protein